MITMFPAKVRSIRMISIPTVFFALALLTHGCSDEITPPAGNVPSGLSGTLVHATECKDNIYGFDAVAPVTPDCVTWDWDGSDTLRLVHINAGLNCCPGTITGLVNVNDSSITIEESEGDDATMCRCLCLYDLTYEISGITGGEITITIVEPYITEGAEILTVTFDLDAEPAGSHCLQRSTYPWSTEQAGDDPVGVIDGYSGCKDVTGTYDDTEPFSADTSCVILYNFPADNLLRIYHTNTAYNCCVDALDAGFEIAEGLITITGIEHPPGGLCDCICLYDVNYSISNYGQGITTIRFVEPYLPAGQEQLEITVDLSVEGTWTYCVPREGYPWTGDTSEEQDQAKLKALFDEIVDYIGTPYCSGEDDCRIIGAGSKPCGGPWMYLIYSAATVDEEHLQGLVSEHASYENYMNMKYGYMSTCDVPIPPILECHEGICGEAR
jgi:hypothetical protein